MKHESVCACAQRLVGAINTVKLGVCVCVCMCARYVL